MSTSKKILAAVIILAAVTLAIRSLWKDSLIVDEIPHVGSGYSYVTTGDYRLNPEHPPLAKDWATLPLAFMNLDQQVYQTRFWQSDLNGQWEFGRRLIFNSGNDADLITHVVKMQMLLFFILSAILIFKWGFELYGEFGAFLALIIFSFSTTVLAHSRFVTTDVPALFGVLYATYFFVRYLKLPTRKNFWLASVFFGIALLLKFSTFLLLPFLWLTALVYGFNNTVGFIKRIENGMEYIARATIIFAVGFVCVVWPVYYLHTMNYPPERQLHDTSTILQSYGNRSFAEPIIWLSDKPVLRAAGQYGLGLLMVNQRSAGGNTTYFLGEVSRFGWHHYFPIVYFMKETLAWWILVLIALLMFGWQLKAPSRKMFSGWGKIIQNHFTEFTMLLWLTIYWGFSINSTLNIGVRHLLPVYPFTILLVSGQLSRLLESAKKSSKKLIAFTVVISGLLGWYVYENLNVFPYYLTYFNQVVGGPSNGYKYVVDSNLDWGQDLVRLSDWVKNYNSCTQIRCNASSGIGCPSYCYEISSPTPQFNQPIKTIETDYFGWADPTYYMGSSYVHLYSSKYRDAQDFIANNQSDGWMAISATFLQGSQGPPDMPNFVNYLWLQYYKPVTVIGNSIFIYHITQ